MSCKSRYLLSKGRASEPFRNGFGFSDFFPFFFFFFSLSFLLRNYWVVDLSQKIVRLGAAAFKGEWEREKRGCVRLRGMSFWAPMKHEMTNASHFG